MELNKRKIMTGATLAGFALALSACSSTKTDGQVTSSSSAQGECHGVNSCKGKGECGGKGNSCAGTNSCKGMGWLKMSKEDCSAKNGTFKEG